MSENGSKVSGEATNAQLLAELVQHVGRQHWTKTGRKLYKMLHKAQTFEKTKREAREAAVKAMAVKPLPCPWCGEQAESFEAMRKWIGADGFQYSCKNCSASGSMARTESEARLAWNMRGGKPQDRRQRSERRVATVAERTRYDQEAPWGLLRRVWQRRAVDRLA